MDYKGIPIKDWGGSREHIMYPNMDVVDPAITDSGTHPNTNEVVVKVRTILRILREGVYYLLRVNHTNVFTIGKSEAFYNNRVIEQQVHIDLHKTLYMIRHNCNITRPVFDENGRDMLVADKYQITEQDRLRYGYPFGNDDSEIEGPADLTRFMDVLRDPGPVKYGRLHVGWAFLKQIHDCDYI